MIISLDKYTNIFVILITSAVLTSCHKYSAKDCLSDRQISDDNLVIPFVNVNIYIDTAQTWVYSILSSFLVGLSGILPLLFIPIEAGPYLRSKAGQKSLNRWLSFGVGSIVGDVFMHLLPEAWFQSSRSANGDQMKIGFWVICGILSFLIIEKIFIESSSCRDDAVTNGQVCSLDDDKADSNHASMSASHDGDVRSRKESKKSLSKTDNNHCNSDINKNVHKAKESLHDREIKIEGYLNLMANVIDNFTHGLAVGGSFLISTRVGVLTTFCILVHEIPHEVSDFVILLRAGFDRWSAAKAQMLTASGSTLGCLFALCVDSATTGRSKAWILPYTSGGFLYIALVSLAPTLLKEECLKESVIQFSLMMVGLVCMSGLSIYCD